MTPRQRRSRRTQATPDGGMYLCIISSRRYAQLMPVPRTPFAKSRSIYVKISNDPEAKKIQADTDHHQTGGMCLRINQFKTVCTNDACGASLLAASAL